MRPRNLKSTSVIVLFPLAVSLLGLVFFSAWDLNENKLLAEQYITDTASLNVEQINRDISQINSELVYIIEQNQSIGQLPPEMTSMDGEYYSLLNDILEQNRILKIRYSEVKFFFAYGQEAGVLITDSGTVFGYSEKTPLYQAVTDRLSLAAADSLSTQWMLVNADGTDYILSWYAKNKKVVGCVIGMDTIYDMLREGISNYQATPFLVDKDGNTLLPQDVTENEKALIQNSGNMDQFISYPLYSLGKVYFYVQSNQGVLETIIFSQIAFVLAVCVITLLGIVSVYNYYRQILVPMQQFVADLEKTDENQMLNETGNNHLMELEMAGGKFRELLRKIQSLKIAIYEKELTEKRAELEYMQEQLRPHFYLNCLSLIHGMADAKGVGEITHITEVLSDYMRYLFRDYRMLREISEELEHVGIYVEIQKLRYGDEAFIYEQTVDGAAGNEKIPSLLLQTLVENAITHGVTLDGTVEISVYITEESYEDGDYIYISVSDTGKGFSREVLEALGQDKPIYYNGRNHVGLKNICHRLEILYGGRASIQFSNMDGKSGAVVEVRIPMESDKQTDNKAKNPSPAG